MSTFNGESFIKQQMDSILIQLSESDELIISDDSSSDKTTEIIKGYNDSRIKLISNCKFRSPIFNIENALKQAKGDYIFLSDQDDIWYKDKVQTTLKYLQKHCTVVSDCTLINEEGIQINSSFFSLNKSRKGLLKNIFKNSYIGCCMAFNRKILKLALPFPKKIAMHDLWIGILSEFFGNPIFINDRLIYYRRHSSNFSQTSQVSRFSIWYKIGYRIEIIILLINRLIHCLMMKKWSFTRTTQ
jgi:glycosyltransferase involved in cell wall biosynthesis